MLNFISMLNSHFYPKNYSSRRLVRSLSRQSQNGESQSHSFGPRSNTPHPPRPSQHNSLEIRTHHGRPGAQSKEKENSKAIVNSQDTLRPSSPYRPKQRLDQWKRDRTLIVKGFQRKPTLDIPNCRLARSPERELKTGRTRRVFFHREGREAEKLHQRRRTMELLLVRKGSKDTSVVQGWDINEEESTNELF